MAICEDDRPSTLVTQPMAFAQSFLPGVTDGVAVGAVRGAAA